MNMSYCVGLTAAVVIWFGPNPSVGYLARVGPAPLRFQTPPNGPGMGPLPPLAMTDPEPPPRAEILAQPPATNSPPVVEATAPVEPVGPVLPMGPVEPAFTPQMFIQFFNEKNGTNRDFNVVVPYQFTPPPVTTIPAPPSRATYILK